MSTFDRLIELIPGHLRAGDTVERGAPLARFLGALAVPLDELERAVAGLLDDHFVERASPQALPLLAALLGAQLTGTDARASRAVLARAIAWRRRRGTLATIEEVLSLTTGWSAELDEGFRSLAFTQDPRHPLSERGRLPQLWDPLVLADPLSRRPARADTRRDERVLDAQRARLHSGEDSDALQRRLGQADAGRWAVSPRTADFRGWARPEGVLIRTARITAVELEDVEPGPVVTRADGRRVFTLDPLGRGGAMLWKRPLERPDQIPTLTERHEAGAEPAETRSATLVLTPTALAAEPEVVEASGSLRIAIDGVTVIGPPIPGTPDTPLAVEPAEGFARLRLADPARPAPGERLRLEAWALDGAAATRLMTNEVAAADPGALLIDGAAFETRTGARVVLNVRRTAGAGAQRDPAGVWSTFAVTDPPVAPLGPVARVTTATGVRLVRPLPAADRTQLAIAVLDPAAPAAGTARTWATHVLGGDRPVVTEGLATVSSGADDTVILVGPDDRGELGVWRVALAPDAASATTTRLDGPGTSPRPPARRAPALAVVGDTLFVFGGFHHERPLGDLWSFPLDGSSTRFTYRPVRLPLPSEDDRQPRGEATLLAAFGGLVLLGGSSRRGLLDPRVWFCDPALSRPAWRALSSLPPPARPACATPATDLPGAVVARAVAGGAEVEALLWADATRPQRIHLAARDGAWTTGALEPAGTNPPAAGDALFLEDGALLIAGAPPLPPSEVVIGLGPGGQLAFLPALDLTPGEVASFDVATDGTTRRTQLELIPTAYRRGPYAPEDLRRADAARLGLPGRLARAGYLLRQRPIGDATGPLGAEDPRVIGLDPRSSRVVLPSTLASGQLTVSYLTGRGSAIGAGCLPPTRSVPPAWSAPGVEVPIPPDLPPRGRGDVDLAARAPLTAVISPRRAGASLDTPGRRVPVVGSAEEALITSAGADHPVLGLLGSARLGRTSLVSPGPAGFSLVALDFGSTPMIVGEPGAGSALSLHGELARLDDPSPGTLWLGGLWVAGRTDVLVTRGALDLRWCTLGQPGEVGLRVAGGQHRAADRGATSLHEIELELRLYGCIVGRVELPPWVRLIASGCTFDAADPEAVAIDAPGATVELRSSTIRGLTRAGELYASSCVFAGEVRASRRDVGWVRYSVLRAGLGAPRLHRTVDATPSFLSVRETTPTYLVLADNNGPRVLSAAEGGGLPGAHGDRGERTRELGLRTEQQIPIGLSPTHLDRVADDLARMGRRIP